MYVREPSVSPDPKEIVLVATAVVLMTRFIAASVMPVEVSATTVPPAFDVAVKLPVPETARVVEPLDVNVEAVRLNVEPLKVPASHDHAPEHVMAAPSVRAVVLAVVAETDVTLTATEVVQVPPPLLPSKVTVSAAPGTEAPVAPPVVAAQ